MSRDKRQNPKEKKSAPSINLRVNILFTVIFLLFITLIGRLYYMQVINRQFYADKLKISGFNTTLTMSEPRGQIFDAKGRPLATTTTVPSVTFTRKASITATDMRNNAIQLVPILRNFIDASTLTDRDKKDYFLSDKANLSAVAAKVPNSKLVDKNGKTLTEAQKYQVYVGYVTSDQINFQGDDLLAAQLYKKMNGTATYATSNIVSGALTAEVQAQIGVQQGNWPGISIGQDWQHNIDQNNLLYPLMGRVGSIQPDDLASYQKKNYSLDDQVGTSYLEKGYEDVLQGKHQVKKLVVNSDGSVSSTTTQVGAQGKNLKLTVNLDFENGVQQILQNAMNSITPKNPYSKGAYVVVENSQTGAILAMNGIDRNTDTGTLSDNSLSPMESFFTPGSVVKPGTLTAGWENGAISGNQVITSQPILLAGSNPILDWYTSGFGPIPADAALEYSSNTYMLQVGLKLLGQDYTPNMTVSTTNRVKAYNEMRAAYGEYGLGVATGIDIPGESTGYVPSTDKSTTDVANLLFETFGQFDNYTPLQLAQYAQTIANNGTRLAPHIVEGIYSSKDSSLGKEETAIVPKIMNKTNISQADMDIIHLGMKEVVYGGNNSSLRTGSGIANNATQIYAKTGTSETIAPDGSTGLTVNNLIAFAPGPAPQIAIGIMVPDITAEHDTHINQEILKEIVDLAVQQGIIKQ